MLTLVTQADAPRQLCLEDLISPVSPREFREQYWEKKHLLIHRGDESHYGRLFTLGDLDHYLALAAKNPSTSLSVGKTSEKGVTLRTLRIQDAEPGQLYSAFHAGSTLMLAGIERCWAPAAELAAVMGEAFDGRAKVNVYITPAGHQGAPIHPDVQDVFVLQTQGSKLWYVYDEWAYEPVENLDYIRYIGKPERRYTQEPPLAERALLRQGDLLYIPRGVLHRAVAPAESPSVHLTVCVTPLCEVDLLKAAVEVAVTEHPELSRSLPLDFDRDPAALESLRKRYRAALERLADERCFERTVRLMTRLKVASSPPPEDGHFEQLLHLDGVGLETTLERRRWQRCLVEIEGEGASIQFGTGRMDGPAALAPAFELIRDHERFQVADLPENLTEKSKLVLVRRLVREGLLRVASAENAS